MPQHDPFLDELLRASAQLDDLIADMTHLPPSQRRHDMHVDQAESIGAALCAAGRSPSAITPSRSRR